MSRFLMFRLYGPLAAWGVLAVGELRPTQDHPSRSAVLGILGAGLGLRRDASTEQASLARGYGVAVRIDSPGTPLEDYHTVQAPRARRGKSWPTRRDELAGEKSELETLVSRRTYVVDALATVALWPRANAAWTLEQMVEALRRPVFFPYLGRKSCPLGIPPGPVIADVPSLLDAFAEADAVWRAAGIDLLADLPKPTGPRRFLWDTDLDEGCWPGGHTEVVRHRRRDQPGDRGRWQFHEREVCSWQEPE